LMYWRVAGKDNDSVFGPGWPEFSPVR
jgi:hypothetical protein